MVKPLKDKHSELIYSLYKPLIFYVPRKLWANVDDGKWLDKEFDPVFDKVMLILEDGSDHVLDDSVSSFQMMSKSSALDKNIYELLDLKAKLTPEAFRFLSERYALSVAFYKKVSSWMLEHIKLDVQEVNEETIKYFEIQKIAFNNHWGYIQNHFSVPEHVRNYVSESDLNGEDVVTMRKFMTDIKVETGNMIEKFQKPKKKEKKILITAESAEKFLLETIFNINF